MFRSLTAAFAALSVLLSAGAAAAQTVGATTDTGGYTSLLDSQSVLGQRIVAPASGLQLQSFRLSLSRNTATLSVEPIVYEVTAGSATGSGPQTLSPLWTGAATPVTNTAAADFTFTPGTTIPLDPAKVYVVAVRQVTPGEEGGVYVASSAYAPGELIIYQGSTFQGYGGDFGFQATFAPVPIPVPTLSEWAMIGLGLLLAGGATLMIQRRRFA